MEFDRDLRARQEVRLLVQQAQLAFEGLQKLDQSGLDGFYYATVMKYFEKLLREPEQLDLPPEEVIRDIP